MKEKICELCSEVATLYCDADHAFLCRTCDEEVHSANFLVARHLRQPLCSNCKAFACNPISGVGLRCILQSPICRNCSPEDDFSGEEQSESSVCISSNESKFGNTVQTQRKMVRVCSSISVTEISGVESSSPVRFTGEVLSEKITSECKNLKRKKTGNDQNGHRALTGIDAKAEGIFGNWCRDLCLNVDSVITVVSMASHALNLILRRTARASPLNVSLAASFWYSLRCLGYNKSARAIHILRRVEEISGVPAKLILAVGLKIDRQSRAQNSRRCDLEEGWAECSG